LLLFGIVDRDQFHPPVVQKVDFVAQQGPNCVQEFVCFQRP
jgi:hypothetical protein